MIRTLISMTGFGSHVGVIGGVKYSFDIRCTNGRHLDLSCKLPRELLRFENEIRETLQSLFSRGRVELFSERISSFHGRAEVSFNVELATVLASKYKQMARIVGCEQDDTAEVILREVLARKEVLEVQSSLQSSELEVRDVIRVVKRAALLAQKSRAREGRVLGGHIQDSIVKIRSLKGKVSKRTYSRISEIRQQVKSKGSAGGESNDRLAEQIDRIDISEEVARLGSHLSLFGELKGPEPRGKKIEFILQEMLREVNTIGSKVQDAITQRFVIEIKNEIERIREQVQNVE